MTSEAEHWMRMVWIVGLLAALVGSGCGSSPRPEPVPAVVAATTPPPPVASPPTRTEVRGEPLLEPDVVASFYRARNGQRAWLQPDSIEQIAQAIDAIDHDGLTPAHYHQRAIATLLDELARASEGDREELEADLDLLVTDAVAGLVDHVRYGRVHPVQLHAQWNVNPREQAPPLEEMLSVIAAAPSTGRAIDDAKPRHFIYRGLVDELAGLRVIDAEGGWPTVPTGRTIKPRRRDPRIPAVRRRLALTGELAAKAATESKKFDATLASAVKLFQSRHRLEPTGLIDAATIAEMNVSASDRADQVRVNLERVRWVLEGLKDDFLLVNLPAYRAFLIRGGKKAWETRTMIGKEARQSPSFQATIRSIVFNPDWTVPPTILAEDVIAGMLAGEDVITRMGLVILDADNHEVDPGSIDWSAASDSFPYKLRQPPGPDNVLGRVKFVFPNKHAIYLHDTPSKAPFEVNDRAMSSGCIRVQRPLELAALLLEGQEGWTPEKIRSVGREAETLETPLDHPMPILIVYWTVGVAGARGEIRYTRDVYGLDAPLLAALSEPPVYRGRDR